MSVLFMRLAALMLAAITVAGAQAQQPTAAAPERSALDAPLFYQLLIGELESSEGRAGSAYEVLLDAARRTRDPVLFQRAVELAVQARAGDQAMAAAQAWREAWPQSLDASRAQLQLAAALNRLDALAEPLATALRTTPDAERAALIASLPRLFVRTTDRKPVAELLDKLLAPYVAAPATRAPVLVTTGRAWLLAGEKPRAVSLAQQAHAADAAAAGPALLALELLPDAQAEVLIASHLAQPSAEPAVHIAYVRVLMQAQRYSDAQRQLEALTQRRPEYAAGWLTLGALRVEMRQTAAGETALQRFLTLRDAQPGTRTEDEDDDPVQAWLLMAEAAEQRGDLPAADAWLARIGTGDDQALDVIARRATLLAKQGQINAAREMIQRAPERRPEDARAKLVAEAQVLRQAKRWQDAHAVLTSADQRYANDGDLLYEMAMMAEKLGRLDEMEQLLRRVIELKPAQQHAYNALGYSLADRNLRLAEARTLIQRAIELAPPGDPFITDSLAWVEYRLGNRAEALRLLKAAYATRPDTEIAAHLGEVLWAAGEHDEARRIWREARERDAANEVLTETLARLRVQL